MKKIAAEERELQKIEYLENEESFLFFTEYLNVWFYESAKMKTT